jgi:protein-S-isoprenylcysteine O-methyltransferase Ste14
MYLAVITSSLGVLFLYRTWAGAILAITMLGLIFRARREERILANAFGLEWQAYATRVPAWLPRLCPREGGT